MKKKTSINQVGQVILPLGAGWYGESQVYKDEETIFNWVLPAGTGMEKSLQR